MNGNKGKEVEDMNVDEFQLELEPIQFQRVSNEIIKA